MALNNLTLVYGDIKKDLSFLKCLGRGHYGQADLVEYRGQLACMKTVFEEDVCAGRLHVDHMREAATLFALDGAGGAPRLYAVAEDKLVIIMEYVEGCSLTKYLEDNSESLRSHDIVLSLAYNLVEIHGKMYHHCDLHSDNVLVVDDGQGDGKIATRIIDFGLAENEGCVRDKDDPPYNYDDEGMFLDIIRNFTAFAFNKTRGILRLAKSKESVVKGSCMKALAEILEEI